MLWVTATTRTFLASYTRTQLVCVSSSALVGESPTHATEVNFTNVFPMYLSHRIEDRKGNPEKSVYWKGLFDKQVMNNCLAQRVPSSGTKTYYNFEDHDNTYL